MERDRFFGLFFYMLLCYPVSETPARRTFKLWGLHARSMEFGIFTAKSHSGISAIKIFMEISNRL
jgi:hypothetical protein